jgi:DNA repair protein RecN (Recombination protein N)
MLSELSVENLLLIERARLRLSAGLNVLTGETGAGKTVLAHALNLLLGGRPRAGIVRPGTDEAYVEGVFELSAEQAVDVARSLDEPRGAPAAPELVLGRRVDADGRTRAYANGRTVTVARLRELGCRLISFYGQHEHRRLTLGAVQLQLLDGTCGEEHERRLEACARAWQATRRCTDRLADLRELALARERELDLIEHELAEIDAANLDERAHEQLLGARERLRRRDALGAAAAAGVQALAPEPADGVQTAPLMADASARLDAMAGVDPSLDALAERLRTLSIESQDLAGELRAYAEGLGWQGGLEDDDVSLEALEERIAATERLVRRHGGSVAAVLEHAARARARREQLLGAELALTGVTRQLAGARRELGEHVEAIRASRSAAARRLSREVCAQLAALGMPEASFDVRLQEREPGPSGADAVELLIAPNPGIPFGPVREIASGGELSRVMLAILAAGGFSSATVVFDEIDAGIGGHTARAVGERLRQLGECAQVVCITHLAQVASLGDRHFSIAKDSSAQPARATVAQLSDGEVVSELMRMLGADASDAGARRHARELRRAA